jgi:hypothetical protein
MSLTFPSDAGIKIISAAFQPSPGKEDELDAWHREEHNEQMAKEPGWKRTTRFKLLFQTRNDGVKADGLDFLTVYEFGEGNKLGKDVQPVEPITDWTKRLMAECKVDAAIYEKVKYLPKVAE